MKQHRKKKNKSTCLKCGAKMFWKGQGFVCPNEKEDIPMKELSLNLKHQKIKPKGFSVVGYMFDDKTLITAMLLRKPLKEMLKEGK